MGTYDKKFSELYEKINAEIDAMAEKQRSDSVDMDPAVASKLVEGISHLKESIEEDYADIVAGSTTGTGAEQVTPTDYGEGFPFPSETLEDIIAMSDYEGDPDDPKEVAAKALEDLGVSSQQATATEEQKEAYEFAQEDDPKSISPFDGALPDETDPLKWAQGVESGKNNGSLIEAVPLYNGGIPGGAEHELVTRGKNNTWIILGRDRDKGLDSGYGGKGHTRAGAIDIVVGLQGFNPRNEQSVEKNFGSMASDKPGDAARIYISQRANIDEYFGICKGQVGISELDSAIGIKADSVRIMARKGIKIVTGQAPQQKTSLGGEIPAQYGIDLIAGNRDLIPGELPRGETPSPSSQPSEPKMIKYLQPIPKGYNLEECLNDIINLVEDNVIFVNSFAGLVMMSNRFLANGIYEEMNPAFPKGFRPASVMQPFSKKLVTYATSMIKNHVTTGTNRQLRAVMKVKRNYLLNSGATYINSRHNRTN